MAALLWRAVLLIELAFSSVIATQFTRSLALPRGLGIGLAIAVALALVLLLQVLLVAISYWRGGMKAHAAGAKPGAGTVVRESIAMLRAAFVMSAFRRNRDRPAATALGRVRPVILVHGIFCNGGIWKALERKLVAARFAPVLVISLEPLLADIDAHARTLGAVLERLHGQCGERVAIVAHSMGGLVARAALRRIDPRIVRQIITLGTPHRGSELARDLPVTPARQMRPDAPWLATLNAAQAEGLDVPLTCLYSEHDNLVVPVTSSEYPRATIIRFSALGHLSLVFSDRVLEAVLAQLRRSD